MRKNLIMAFWTVALIFAALGWYMGKAAGYCLDCDQGLAQVVSIVGYGMAGFCFLMGLWPAVKW